MKSDHPLPSVTTADFVDVVGVDVNAIVEILRPLLADAFALYLKTKSFHWHVVGPRFYEMHLLFDSQAEQIAAMTDNIAERARKVGGTALRSIGDVARHQRLADDDRFDLTPDQMVAALLEDNRKFARFLRSAHDIAARYGDLATASLIENWIDQAEQRAWFLSSSVGAPSIESSALTGL